MFTWLQKRQIDAILILQEQNAFDKAGKPVIDRYQYEGWQQLTGEYIKKFLGKDSKFYTDFTELKLLVVPIQNKPSEKELALELWNLTQANGILQNCIIYIAKFKYLYREPSLFGLLPITGQISLAIFGATLFFYIGRFTVPEKPTFEHELKECRKSVELLMQERDTLLVRLSNIPANENAEHKPDK